MGLTSIIIILISICLCGGVLCTLKYLKTKQIQNFPGRHRRIFSYIAIILYAICILCVFYLIALKIALVPLGVPKDYREEMKVYITRDDNGYIAEILSCGGFPNLTLGSHHKWQIWDAKNTNEISSGYLLAGSGNVRWNDTNKNNKIDTGDKILIDCSSHNYGGYYFILSNESTRLTIIHAQIPQ